MSVPILDSDFCVIWSNVLIHSLWQGLIILLLAYSVNRGLQNSSATARYAVLGISQVLLFTSLVITFAVLKSSTAVYPGGGAVETSWQTRGGGSPKPVDAEIAENGGSELHSLKLEPQTDPALSPVRIYAAVAYFVGTGVMLLRLVIGAFSGQQLVARSRPITEARVLRNIGHAVVAMRFSYTPAIAFCDSILVPSVVGILRPTLLLPLAALSGLTPRELELLVMHELAHIRRHDHIANILLRIVEAFTFYHPVSWILSRQLRHERELCCDDAVIAAGGSAECYAEALLRMVEISFADRPTNVDLVRLAATGDVSGLRVRVNRLIQLDGSDTVRMRPLGAALCAMVALIMFGSSLGMMSRTGPMDPGYIQLKSELGSDPSLVTERIPGGYTRLHRAAGLGGVDEIALLLANGADLHAASDGGWRPLHMAVSYGRIENVIFLVRSGAPVNGPNKDGKTPLHVAARMLSKTSGRQYLPIDIRMVQLLCDLGADVNLADHRGLTPLFGAIERGEDAIVEELLRRGANVNARDKAGSTPFMAASAGGDLKLMSFLLANGANPLVADSQGRNAIDALCVRDPETVGPDARQVAECFAFLKSKNVPVSPTSAAAMGDARLLAEQLQSDPTLAHIRPTQTVRSYALLHWAVAAQSPETCTLLISCGADPSCKATNDVTPLHVAVNRANPDLQILGMLLGNAAECNAQDKLGRTALYVATVRGHTQIVTMLIERGADVRLADTDLRTPLHRLAEFGWSSKISEQISQFIGAGADPNAADRDGRTPLHDAVARGRIEMISLLLKAGANPKIRDQQGKSPLDQAESIKGLLGDSVLQQLRRRASDTTMGD